MRAKTVLGKKRTAFYHSLPALALAAALIMATYSHAQEITRHEGILIDVSGSIGRGGQNHDLLNEYLRSAKHLLATEPPNSRVWVSVITTDSFGGVRELMKGWTPGTQGVFTDNLNRARRQLAADFETKSSGLSPDASGTDIIGALWHMKALLDSPSGSSQHPIKEIWIFSDMVNETAAFPMPALIALGPERMLERAQANGPLVSLRGYRIHVVGASTAGLDPKTWNAVKEFWTALSRAAGAELASYSAESSGAR